MYGAEIVYSEGSKGSNGAVEMALDMAEKDPRFYMPYQYGNQANPDAHYYGTAEEIIEQLGDVTAFVAGLGTGGTLMGNGRRLKEHDPSTLRSSPPSRSRARSCRACARSTTASSRRSSTSRCSTGRSWSRTATGSIWTQRLFFEEGVFAGVSSGAIASVAVRVADELDEGNVVFVVSDDGSKYLSRRPLDKSVDELEAVDSTVWW